MQVRVGASELVAVIEFLDGLRRSLRHSKFVRYRRQDPRESLRSIACVRQVENVQRFPLRLTIWNKFPVINNQLAGYAWIQAGFCPRPVARSPRS